MAKTNGGKEGTAVKELENTEEALSSEEDLGAISEKSEAEAEALEAAGLGFPFPIRRANWASGLYEWSFPGKKKVSGRGAALSELDEATDAEILDGMNEETLGIPRWAQREELRLDVDKHYPQLVASGTLYRGLTTRLHWIANLQERRPNLWTGVIWYKDGDASTFPFTRIMVRVQSGWFHHQRKAHVWFYGGGGPVRHRLFKYKSPYFHPVEFEYDWVKGTDALTEIQTCAHPNRPAGMSCERLSIREVFQRAGFDVKISRKSKRIPLAGAGADAEWSNMEMHDAMQIYWSRFVSKAQWAMWVLFASLHESGTGLGGIMFDSIGPNHRQGTALFNDSFIAQAPAGDPNPDAWVKRMRFWTACHEMGHSFNLAHSWQKELGTPWIPINNEGEERSFMNYPYFVSGGQSAFFSDFEYRFSDSEMLFMRHSPSRFVQMGNADWFDHHGFEQAEESPEPAFRLELRANRDKALYEFMEPVVLELKLTNLQDQPQLVNEHILENNDQMMVVLKKRGGKARQWVPFARYCYENRNTVLNPGKSKYESLFISAGQNGSDLAEPGDYVVQIMLTVGGEDIVSNPMHLRVTPPKAYEEELLAQDFFSEDVGRILTFDGSQYLEKGNDILREVSDKLNDRRVAIHAQVALGNPLAYDYKTLNLGTGPEKEIVAACQDKGNFKITSAKVDAARKEIKAALTDQADTAAETLGHVDYKYYTDQFKKWLTKKNDTKTAGEVNKTMRNTLSNRKVPDSVFDES